MYPFEAISMRRKLGGGAFGDVFEVLVGGDMVAAMKVSSDAAVDAGALDHERALLESLPPHANVVTVWGLCTDAPDGKLRVIMELCQPHLHSSGIVHRDFRADNLLVSSRDPLCVKVTDFGIAHAMSGAWYTVAWTVDACA